LTIISIYNLNFCDIRFRFSNQNQRDRWKHAQISSRHCNWSYELRIFKSFSG